MVEKPESIVIDLLHEEDIELKSGYEIGSTVVHPKKKKSKLLQFILLIFLIDLVLMILFL
tara:strand:+ start:162 stop:341 length:180 start_codon:yes stop_codon:yes gene_type:complete